MTDDAVSVTGATEFLRAFTPLSVSSTWNAEDERQIALAMVGYAQRLSTPRAAASVEQREAVAYNAARDPLHEILRELHREAWNAGVFTSQEEWPDDDEQEELARAVDSVDVGEHYDAWGNPAVERLLAPLALTSGEVAPKPEASALRGALDSMLHAFAEGVIWNDEQRSAYEHAAALADNHPASLAGRGDAA